MSGKKASDKDELRNSQSRIRALFGSIQPRSRPEDFRKLREEFERGVAEEVMSETEDPGAEAG